MAIALAVSVVANLLLAALIGPVLYRRWRRRARPDYAKLAGQRFQPPRPGEVCFVGDSMVGDAPLLEVLTGCSQRGIGGQRIADVRSWAASLAGAERVVLWVGVNDLGEGATVEEVVGAYGDLLDAVPVDVEAVVLALPPLNSHDVDPVNDALAKLAAERGVRFERLPDLAGFSDDGVHLTREGYERLTSLLRHVAG